MEGIILANCGGFGSGFTTEAHGNIPEGTLMLPIHNPRSFAAFFAAKATHAVFNRAAVERYYPLTNRYLNWETKTFNFPHHRVLRKSHLVEHLLTDDAPGVAHIEGGLLHTDLEGDVNAVVACCLATGWRGNAKLDEEGTRVEWQFTGQPTGVFQGYPWKKIA